MTDVPHPLLVLAMDHRAVMRGLFGDAVPAAERREAFGRVKDLAFDALVRTIAEGGTDPANLGVLIDEEYGERTIPRVREAGCCLVLPVEESRSPVFDINTGEFVLTGGDDFAARLDALGPDMVKALIVHNPELPAGRRARQTARARQVLDWCQANRRPFMLEMLVPPTDAQLAAEGGDKERWQRAHHTELLLRTVSEYQDAGVWPHVWKLEPLAAEADYAVVADHCRAGAPYPTSLVLLGGGADMDAVAEWVRQIRGVDGYIGFAIGRSLWIDAFDGYLRGDLDEEQVVASIAGRLRRLVTAYSLGEDVPSAAR
ncbi:2-deoxy-5-keto-D-gluconate 6-phosphate aldolase domain-containing protein [Streptomyces sp. NPDC008079]|uniref:2-deoxy-5-keto-D-gluconate 6-phosphate aldolase domain-containing protein n=1 Tax=Streptomyces sp. NPDC008079 TaxID=3364806 RepID=UPI0036E48DD8